MADGWVKVKDICGVQDLTSQTDYIEEKRKYWANVLEEFNVDYKFDMKNQGQFFVLCLYVRKVDEVKTLKFLEDFEKPEMIEQTEELAGYIPVNIITIRRYRGRLNDSNKKNQKYKKKNIEKINLEKQLDDNIKIYISLILSMVILLIITIFCVDFTLKDEHFNVSSEIKMVYLIIFIVFAIGIIALLAGLIIEIKKSTEKKKMQMK